MASVSLIGNAMKLVVILYASFMLALVVTVLAQFAPYL